MSLLPFVFFFKQKTAYEMRISDWSSDVCSSDLKGFALWDASIVYTAPDDRWSLWVFGKNLTDKEYKTSGYTFVNFNPVTDAPSSALRTEGTLTAFSGNPRQYFVTGYIGRESFRERVSLYV